MNISSSRKSVVLTMACFLMITCLVAGCKFAGKEEDQSGPVTVTFQTFQTAPDEFEAWTFYWKVPYYDRSLKLDYVVLEPDGKEYSKYDMGRTPSGALVQSDFARDFAGGDPAVFFNKTIRFKVRVDSGPLRFPIPHDFYFEFYRIDERGKFDRDNPVATLKAVTDENHLREAAVIPPEMDLAKLVFDRGSRSSGRKIGTDLHREAVKLFQKGKYDACIENEEKEVARSPKRNWSWYILGRARYESGDVQGALEAFTRLVDQCPWGPYLYEKGRILKELGREEEGVAAHKKALEILDTETGYKSFQYADTKMEGKKPRSKKEIVRLLSGEG
ncbi:MAG: tetratricopeptide repeat protein [Planctomycetota bacterium]|jgi:hypothetical protein